MRRLRLAVRRWVERRGFRITRVHAPARHGSVAVGATPPAALTELVTANPRLVELRRRYAAFDSPLSAHTYWSSGFRRHEIDLAQFRGDNAYVWQRRQLGDEVALRYLAYLQYVEARDPRGLLSVLEEDGAFGCWTFDYGRPPLVTRDLLDSVNELYFLDRAWGLFGREQLSILDIGAGYGRLAHRTVAAVDGLARYDCVDAVPESTFLCEYYLRHRGVLGRAAVVPVDELAAAVVPDTVDLAINIHAFSEMSHAAVEAWMAELARLRVRALFIVPNDGDQLLSIEADGTRRDFAGAIEAAGFRLTTREPVIADPAVREAMDLNDIFCFFEAR